MVQSSTKFKFPELFIVSSGRSGTTLLSLMVNASELIYIPYESDFIARAYPHYGDYHKFTKEDYQQIIKIFQKSAKKKGWGMSFEYLLGKLRSDYNNMS